MSTCNKPGATEGSVFKRTFHGRLVLKALVPKKLSENFENLQFGLNCNAIDGVVRFRTAKKEDAVNLQKVLLFNHEYEVNVDNNNKPHLVTADQVQADRSSSNIPSMRFNLLNIAYAPIWGRDDLVDIIGFVENNPISNKVNFDDYSILYLSAPELSQFKPLRVKVKRRILSASNFQMPSIVVITNLRKDENTKKRQAKVLISTHLTQIVVNPFWMEKFHELSSWAYETKKISSMQLFPSSAREIENCLPFWGQFDAFLPFASIIKIFPDTIQIFCISCKNLLTTSPVWCSKCSLPRKLINFDISLWVWCC
ncbi:uncharacterized protein LOC132195139 isoform X2 [Neocloeon triangulifer]|uniref:uncharacterized protein LOC132195139 isoform X2 n=1 Tax=Neocloeon triangulifer TaxID=2078957 RepID=UPI00286F36A1|nr:uncharacterized protein LOC132195139 isoform X2 [Neocloeon triangulifer]